MADSKITALTALTAADPANDMIPIVDVSDTPPASGNTKRISINNILACSPSATLASATITGDLTVDTSTLKVDSANNRVGVGTASPSVPLEIRASDNSVLTTGGSANFTQFKAQVDSGVGTSIGSYQNIFGYVGTSSNHYLEIRANNIAQQKIEPLGIFSWFDGAGGTRMTLNATGLGVGASPAHKLQAVGGYVASGKLASASSGDIGGLLMYCSTDNGGRRSWGLKAESGTTGVLGFWLSSANNTEPFSGTQVMSLDASGNLLVGTTSALASGSTIQNLGASRQVLTLKGDAFGSYTAGIWNASTTNDGLFVYFGTEASLTVRGGISYNRGGGLVAYNTTSDYRAKDIIGPVSNSGSLIDSLKVYVGKMKGATIERPMLIAHEAQEVAPYAVTGTKDEVDAEGKPKYQQMDASALVPLLIAEIQSLRARVQTLEAK